MFDEEQLRKLGHAERLRLIRALVAMESPEPATDRARRRRQTAGLAAIVICCVILAAWIGVLAVTLPRYYTAGGWRAAWVGLDLAELAAFAATGWAAWRRRQVLIICLAVLATLLFCDAWFDVVLDARTAGFELSLLSALIIELPLAALAAWGARRLLLTSVAVVRRYEGEQGPPPSLRRAPLIGGSLAPQLTEPAPGSTEVPVTNVSAEQSDTSLPFGSAAASYDRLRFFPSAEAISWLLRGDERCVLDLAAGTGQVTGQLVPLGLTVVAVEPDQQMRAVFAARFPRNECLDGTAERIPLPDDGLDAVIVGSAWHWFNAPAALTEIARVLRDRRRLGVFAASVDAGVDWVRDMFTEVSPRAQQRGADSARNVTLPSADFSGVEEAIFSTSQAMDVADVVAWFRTHSTYLNADAMTKMAMADRVARVLREVFPGERTVEIPVMTLCWRTERLPR